MKYLLMASALFFPFPLYGQDTPALINSTPVAKDSDTLETKKNPDDLKEEVGLTQDGGIRRWSLGAGLPDGGSPYLMGSLSLRYFVNQNVSLSSILLASYDKQSQQQSFAGGLRAQNFFSEGRSSLYAFLQFLIGQNTAGTRLNTIEYNSDLEFGMGSGIGIEVWLIPQVSIAVETGFSARLSPSSKIRFTTGTSKVGLYVHN